MNSDSNTVKPVARAIPFVIAGALLGGCGTAGAEAPVEQPPEVTFSQRLADATRNVVQCMNERGWVATFVGPGQFSTEGPADQQDRADEDRAECMALHMAVLPDVEILPAHWDAYFAQLELAADCLRGLGFTVSEPPSRATLVDAAVIDRDASVWDPYAEILNAGFEHAPVPFTQVRRTCPQPDIVDFVG